MLTSSFDGKITLQYMESKRSLPPLTELVEANDPLQQAQGLNGYHGN